MTFNDGTIYPYVPGSPQLSSADHELVEQRTPGFVTWQGNHWLMCCGRACVYLGEAKAGDLQGRWKQAAAAIFESDDLTDSRKVEILSQIGLSASPAAYIFQCQQCRRLLGYWDCD